MRFSTAAAPNARVARIALWLSLTLVASPAAAQRELSAFNLPAQPLKQALIEFSRQSRVQILFPDELVEGRTAPAVSGRFSNQDALAMLLAGSGFVPDFEDARTVRLVAQAPVAPTPVPGRVAAALPPRPEEIVVTGTRIRGTVPVGSEMITLDRSAIDLAGRSTATELLRIVPQNTSLAVNDEVRVGITQNVQNTAFGSSANLRGLGPAATLVLFNGHRMAPTSAGAFVDVSQIPLSAIERIEIVADGASSIYGSDAIGGVINFVLRHDFRGSEVSVRNEFADGINRFTASAITGASWDGGNLFVGYEHHHQTSLSAKDRDYYTSDLRRFGGPDLRAAGNIPGTISANGTTYALPPNQNGRNLSAASLVPGTSNPYDNDLDASILPTQRRDSFSGSVQQALNDTISVNADGFYSRRSFGTYLTTGNSVLTVPRSNPFFVSPVAGAQSVTVLYSLRDDLGAPFGHGTSQNYSLNGGVSAKLGASWRASLSASYAADITHERVENVANTTALNAALADPDPATAFNPFASQSVTNPATLDAIRGYTADRHQRFRIKSAALRADGGLFDLPGGSVRLAAGAEYRLQGYDDTNFSFSSGTRPALSAPSSLRRRIASFDAELLVPIFGQGNELPGFHRLDISASARTERYSDVGRTTNPKFGVGWLPVEGVALRGSWGTSFRAPLLTQLGDPTILSTIVPDARSPTGRSNVVAILGNNRDLKPEKATTWSAGADLTPRQLPGLKISGTYFSIDYRNRILNLAAETAQVLVREDIYAGLITRNPSAAQVQALYDSPFLVAGSARFPANTIAAIIDGRFNNVGVVHESGFDFSASWELNTSQGVFIPVIGIAWITDYTVGRTATAPVSSSLNRSGSPIDLRGRAGVAWTKGRYDGSLFVNYVNAYHNFSVIPVAQVDSLTTVDAQIGFRFGCVAVAGDACQVQLTVQNLLDQKPPVFVNTAGRVAYDPEQASAIGRVIALDLTLRF
ncbi:MAG: TonB-dependent receptor [Rhodospirillales bacterium]|nr:TonB-dependent receptor [Rhodospirillales bacterium]